MNEFFPLNVESSRFPSFSLFQELCRHILANQHKLKKLIQLQSVRLCSSTARLQEAIIDEDDMLRPAQVPLTRQDVNLKPIEHEKDLGHHFKYSDMHVQLCAPHQLQPKPEADDLKFGKHFTDHMMKIAYHKRLGGWQSPEIVPFGNLVLHPAAKVFHYALEVGPYHKMTSFFFFRILYWLCYQ